MKTDLNNLLTLIAATIFADKRIYASEVKAFVKYTSTLNVARQMDPNLSEARLLIWYENNKDDIRQQIASSDFAAWFYGVLEQLTDVPEKESILEIMREISSADGEVHVSEVALITLAQRYWNLHLASA